VGEGWKGAAGGIYFIFCRLTSAQLGEEKETGKSNSPRENKNRRYSDVPAVTAKEKNNSHRGSRNDEKI